MTDDQTASDPRRVELPGRVFTAALSNYHRIQEARVLAMYNRHRAVFAEFIVAALLEGSTVVTDPSAGWDVEWPVSGTTIRVQVKCSGQYLPRMRTSTNNALWKLKEPKYGWAPDQRERLASGHHCDLFILARHEGTDVKSGWSFAPVLPKDFRGRSSLSANGPHRPETEAILRSAGLKTGATSS